ncbi:MAG: GxxExxY protein [Candidatus Magasanikbacteria bacterium]|nr:GxxExxY protein [Candidatus Magasanikbacteria bacterium]
MNDLIYKDLSFKINGILFEVHNELGRYANEKQVCDLMEKKFILIELPYEREFVPNLSDRGEKINRNRLDFIIDRKIILEIKCKSFLTREDYYQIQRYLTSLNLKLGILINFRDERLHPKRILNSLGKE